MSAVRRKGFGRNDAKLPRLIGVSLGAGHLIKEYNMASCKTVVLLGGESEEREISIQSGTCIANALKSIGIEVDTFDWHPSKMREFLDKGYERVFIALHGGSGENGTVQAMLDLAGIPYTGIGMRPASICMDKQISKTIVTANGVPVPKCISMNAEEALENVHDSGDGINAKFEGILNEIGLPIIVKPARNGSSVGVTLVEDRKDFLKAVKNAYFKNDIIMFEQYIKGYELTVAMLNGKALGVCQIIPKNKFYDYDAKYNRSDTEYLTPSALGAEFDKKLCHYAEMAASALDCVSGVVRIDFLADKDLNPYFLEVNSVPGMTSHSLVPKIAANAGYDFPTLCKMILDMI